MVHLILPEALSGTTGSRTVTPGRRPLRQWQRETVLIRDPEPAFYYWETDFEHQGQVMDPQRPGDPGAPGALKRRGRQAPRTDLLRGQGRPPGTVQTGPGPIFRRFFPSIGSENRVLSLLQGSLPSTPLEALKTPWAIISASTG